MSGASQQRPFNTLAVFNEPGPDGKAPFHHYNMRQAIEEGFIHDALARYTCYKRYYKLIQKVKNDPEVPRRKAARALARFVEFHDYEIAQKVEVTHWQAGTSPATTDSA